MTHQQLTHTHDAHAVLKQIASRGSIRENKRKNMSYNQFVFSHDQKKRLEQFGIQSVYMFGSRAEGTAHPLSDFDFAVLLRDARQLSARKTFLYQELYDLFSSMIRPETRAADVVDIVFLQSPFVPLELTSYIVRHGQVLFDADPSARVDFETTTMLHDADCAPIQKEMQDALLARL